MTKLKNSNLSPDNGFKGSSDGNNLPKVGGAQVNELHGVLRAALNQVDTAGGVFSIENDTENDYIVDLGIVDVTTASSGSCTLDIGISTAADSSSNTIFDGLDVNSATGIFNTYGTTASAVTVALPSGQFITGSVATGASDGLAGNAYFRIVRR